MANTKKKIMTIDEVDVLAKKISQLDSLVKNLANLSAYLNRYVEQQIKQFNLPISSFEVLIALHNNGEPKALTPSELLTNSSVSSGTMTNRIDQLVKKRLLKRQQNKDDRRSVAVVLTGEGAKVAGELLTIYNASLIKLLSKVKFKQLLKLNMLTDKLYTKLSN